MKYLPFFLLFAIGLSAQNPEIELKKGLVIKQSCRIKPGVYALAGDTAEVYRPNVAFAASLAKAVIVISGNNLSVDFHKGGINGATVGPVAVRTFAPASATMSSSVPGQTPAARMSSIRTCHPLAKARPVG